MICRRGVLRLLKVFNNLFVFACYAVAILTCVFIFIDGKDGISIALKIFYIPIAVLFAWIVSEIPRQIFRFAKHASYSKVKLITGISCIILFGAALAIIILPFNDYKNDSFTTSTVAPAGSPQFLETFARLVGSSVGQGNTVIPLYDGSEFATSLLQTMKVASSTIDFTTFPWADGTFSDQVFTVLTNAAQRGVRVRVLLDAFGSHSLSKTKIKILQDAGGKVVEYHPFTILNPLAYDDRDHIRSIVVDGKIGYIGGMGISDDWYGGPPDKTFEDMMFEVSGSMAESLQDSFAQIWNETTGEVLSGPLFYPSIANNITQNTFTEITSIPSDNFRPIRDAFLLSALSAQKKLYVVSSYIVPDQDFLTILEDKARSGVDVRIVSPGTNTVAPVLRAAWHADYNQLLDAGVKIYEYQPTMIHAKFMVVDDLWSLIGSANIDNRSETLNAENEMGVSDPMLANSLDQTFMNYISKSEEISLTEWRRRYGFFSRFYSNVLLLFARQY